MKSYNKFYNALYKGEINLKNLREQKKISPSKRVKREIIKQNLINLPYNSSILEIGCGVGDIIGMLNYKYKTGIDISKEAVNKAKLIFPDTVFRYGNANKKLKLKSDSYNAIVLADVIEHVKNDSLLLKESNRLLKKKGMLIVITPYSGKKETLDLKINLKKESFGIGGDLRIYGLNLIDKIKKSSFSISKIRFINGPLGNYVWNLKNKVLGKKREDIAEKIMTGNFMAENKTKRFINKIALEILYQIYALDAKLFSYKNKPGIIFIIALKNE